MSRSVSRRVEKRRIVHISGFEPVEPETLDRRMQSGLRRFAPVWGAVASSTPFAISEDRRAVSWHVETRGPNWTTRCDYTILRWDELMAPYVDRPWLVRIVSGYRALFEFWRTGTVRRYFKANVRYGLFVIYPVLVLVGFFLLAILAAAALAVSEVPFKLVLAPAAGLAVFALLMRTAGSYFFIDFALADWAFAADCARQEIAGLDDILDRFSAEVLAAIRDSDADEVLLSGISLGAVMMVEALARAYAADPDLARHARRAAFLTVGSSLLKIGLHPAASGLRQAVGRIGGEPSLFWVEYQAKVDPINFYKTDPVADMGLPASGRPKVQFIRIRDMMSPEQYSRARRSMIHLHRQFVMPNAQRYFYDFYHICFGPMALKRRAGLRHKAVRSFSKDGRYRLGRRARNRKAVLAAGE